MVVRKLLGWINPQRLVDLAFRVRPNSEFIIFHDQRLTRRMATPTATPTDTPIATPTSTPTSTPTPSEFLVYLPISCVNTSKTDCKLLATKTTALHDRVRVELSISS